MKYLCLISAEKLMEAMSASDAEAHLEEYRRLTNELRISGHLVGCNRLCPPDGAITIRVRNGRMLTTDGPFAETKEQIGGYFVIEARDMNEAIHVAAQIPGARLGCVEVRPIAEDAQTRKALG